ncbi:hypothetical protein BDP27DRAFT_1419028 [Rhodocollybia butyracea]|uniref:Uncharacterized protein n=1 Tax=Rhodocollybia butyracea TaxID=206335 RepID=A0A9P5PYA0_9AGAR|nr:hypothetical protein BDP27DRAFT_1419028 [Rhodocollybia butyracea]
MASSPSHTFDPDEAAPTADLTTVLVAKAGALQYTGGKSDYNSPNLSLPNYLNFFHSTISQNLFIVSSVRTLTLSLFAGSMTPETDEIPELPFTQLHSLQVCYAHTYHDLIDVQTTQLWRLPRLIRLIQMNPSLQHLAIDACNLEASSWDTLFSDIASLHTLVLRCAVVVSESHYYGAKVTVSGSYASHNKIITKEVLDALALDYHACRQGGGHRTLLMKCSSELTSLTIATDPWTNNGLQAIVNAPAFSNLSRLQFTSASDLELEKMVHWLINKCTPLQFFHLTCINRRSLGQTIDTILLNLVTSMPSLQLITARIIKPNSRVFASKEDLEDMLPQTFGTGKVRYGEISKWWEVQ